MPNQVTLQFPGYADLGVRTAPDAASLKRFISTSIAPNDFAILGGGSVAGDGNGGVYIYLVGSTANDSAISIKPDDLGPSEQGRWIAIIH